MLSQYSYQTPFSFFLFFVFFWVRSFFASACLSPVLLCPSFAVQAEQNRAGLFSWAWARGQKRGAGVSAQQHASPNCPCRSSKDSEGRRPTREAFLNWRESCPPPPLSSTPIIMSDGLQQRGEGKLKARPEDDPLSVLDENGAAEPLDDHGEHPQSYRKWPLSFLSSPISYFGTSQSRRR